MAQNRRDILSALETLMGTVSGIVTVVRTYMDIDITQYTESQLPLIEIKEPDEEPKEEMTAMRQLSDLSLELKVWFVSWGQTPTSAYETLVKNIRDKIGDNFTVSSTIVACYVTGIDEIGGQTPVYNFEMTLQMEYYLSLRGT